MFTLAVAAVPVSESANIVQILNYIGWPGAFLGAVVVICIAWFMVTWVKHG